MSQNKNKKDNQEDKKTGYENSSFGQANTSSVSATDTMDETSSKTTKNTGGAESKTAFGVGSDKSAQGTAKPVTGSDANQQNRDREKNQENEMSGMKSELSAQQRRSSNENDRTMDQDSRKGNNGNDDDDYWQQRGDQRSGSTAKNNPLNDPSGQEFRQRNEMNSEFSNRQETPYQPQYQQYNDRSSGSYRNVGDQYGTGSPNRDEGYYQTGMPYQNFGQGTQYTSGRDYGQHQNYGRGYGWQPRQGQPTQYGYEPDFSNRWSSGQTYGQGNPSGRGWDDRFDPGNQYGRNWDERAGSRHSRNMDDRLFGYGSQYNRNAQGYGRQWDERTGYGNPYGGNQNYESRYDAPFGNRQEDSMRNYGGLSDRNRGRDRFDQDYNYEGAQNYSRSEYGNQGAGYDDYPSEHHRNSSGRSQSKQRGMQSRYENERSRGDWMDNDRENRGGNYEMDDDYRGDRGFDSDRSTSQRRQQGNRFDDDDNTTRFEDYRGRMEEDIYDGYGTESRRRNQNYERTNYGGQSESIRRKNRR